MMHIFKDRHDAAMQLAVKLEKYKDKDGIVLAVPRGGVPIGYIIARELGLPLEIILSKKIGYPGNPEFAIGSVTLEGAVVNGNIEDISQEYIDSEVKRISKNLKTRFKLFMGDRKPTNLKYKTVIIVDDGVATGSTIKATIQAVREKTPKEIIVAVPVSPPETARRLSEITDEFICLHIPHDFFGVGQFYDNFEQVSDQEVIKLLNEANPKSEAA